MKLSELHPNPDNPRYISKKRFEDLKKSLKEFHKMLELRPIIINNEGLILAGNQRYNALVALDYKEIPDEWVKKAENLTEKEKERLTIIDNLPFGNYDYDILANQWNTEELIGWGMEIMNTGIEDITKEWEGMPEFEQEDKNGYQTLTVHIKTKEDVEKFAKIVDQKITDKTRFIWFPNEEIDKNTNERYINES